VQAASWLEHYDEGMPATLGPYPERTLLDDLADAAAGRRCCSRAAPSPTVSCSG
jgi:hypothetical protein